MAAAQSSTSISVALPLLDKVAIITGASRGIGKSIALHLGSLGAKVVINYSSNSTQAEQLATQINSTSIYPVSQQPQAIAVQADVSDPIQVSSDPIQVSALFDSAERTFDSKPDFVITSAGVLDSKYPSIAETQIEDFDNIFNVNTRGVFLCIKEAANRVKRGGGGRIVVISSSLAAAFRPGFGAYTASKAAVEAMTKILAKELKGTGITANCVAPGPIATEMFFEGKSKEMIQKVIDESPLCRLGETKDIAPVVGFLCSDGAEWINGQIIRVNGGYV